MGAPRIVIAGCHSGAGKTSVSVALVAALTRRGLRVQTFKVGPDYLDPTYLSRASGRPSYNLDGFMMGRNYVRHLAFEASRDADLSIIEGAMGFFDGLSPEHSAASTAEIAQWLEAPVLLVVDAHGVSRSFAATVLGFTQFEAGVSIAGIVANHVGSRSHGELLSKALEARGLPPLVARIPRGAFPSLPSRHLGLISADDATLSGPLLDAFADAIERTGNLSQITEMAASAAPIEAIPAGVSRHDDGCARLGVAMDEAFQFYYADNLRALEQQGVTIVPFSPLRDPLLPADLDGLYFGGGYPELHAKALSDNRAMIEAVRHFASAGRPVYAECGGLMYLAQGITTKEGAHHPFAGILPISVRMLPGRKALGYAEVELAREGLFGPRGKSLRGHEFHYSEIEGDGSLPAPWQSAYRVRRPRTGAVEPEGLQCGNVVASYVHLHFASDRDATSHFVRALRHPDRRAMPCPTSL